MEEDLSEGIEWMKRDPKERNEEARKDTKRREKGQFLLP